MWVDEPSMMQIISMKIFREPLGGAFNLAFDSIFYIVILSMNSWVN